MDTYLSRMAKNNKLNIYCAVPFLCVAHDGYSDLRKKDVDDSHLFQKAQDLAMSFCLEKIK